MTNWHRHLHPTGVPFYTPDGLDGYMVEAEVRLSSHVGMVFGQYVNEAGRGSRITGWRALHDGRSLGLYRTLAAAKAAVERRLKVSA